MNSMGFLFFSVSATIDLDLCSRLRKDLLDGLKNLSNMRPADSGLPTGDSKSVVREDVRVQVPLPASEKTIARLYSALEELEHGNSNKA